MDETATDNGLHNHNAVLESYIQGCYATRRPGGRKEALRCIRSVIHANEGVPSDIRFTPAATNDSFMLRPASLGRGDIMAMDRAYIDYEKFQQLTERGVI